VPESNIAFLRFIRLVKTFHFFNKLAIGLLGYTLAGFAR